MSLNQKQETMRAVRIHEFGAPSVMKTDTIDLPDPQADEILVRIAATSVNPVDYKIREGRFPLVLQENLPVTLGRDFAGTIEICDTPSSTLKLGDEVYGMPAFDRGTYAEFVVVKATEVCRKPKTLDLTEAGVVPLVALTAWQGLFDHGQLQSGQRVLIHAGSGGVGHMAVQFAKNSGAEVITTTSAPNLDFVRELGADMAIDYKAQRFEDVCGEVDLVLDLTGGETQDRSWKIVRQGGALISAVSPPSEELAKERNVRIERYRARPNAHQLADIAALIDGGKVRAVTSKIFSLSQIASAHEFAQKGGFRGKIGITV